MEITLTTSESEIQIIFNGERFILDFIYNNQIYATLKQMEDANFADFGVTIPKKWSVPKAGYLELNRLLSERIIWKTPEELQDQRDNLNIDEETLLDVMSRIPKQIDTPLMTITPYDFQKVAVAWAVTPKGKRGQIYGGLLADTMGLGKTIEALAISTYLKSMNLVNRVLVITPATLKMQWEQEIQRFTNEKVTVIDGDQKKRKKLFQKLQESQDFYTVINYELLRGREVVGIEKQKKKVNGKWTTVNKKVYGDYIDLNYVLQQEYDMVVIDEAHRMKNPDTQTTIAIRHIDAPYKLLMTGTPIEKDLKNIFQLLDYLSPNILSSSEHNFEERRKQFEDRFLVIGWNPFNTYERELIPLDVKNVEVLKRIISPYMLRRTTEDVSDEIPDMNVINRVVDWEPEQRALYNKLKSELIEIAEKKAQVKTPEDKEKLDNETNALLMYMLEVCNTPELLAMSDSPLAKMKLGKKKKFPTPNKLKRVIEMAEEILTDSQDKIVIFSKFERMTQILKRELDELSLEMARTKGKKPGSREFGTVMYTGTTPTGCKWKKEIEKNGSEAKNLNCLECPFVKQCNTRTKSAFMFQNHPSARIIIATDAANYGVYIKVGSI